MNKKYNYIIIGGGISGLHLGALLSQHGKVLILEKLNILGGRARVSIIDDFKLDFGPHPIRFGPDSALGTSLLEINKSVNFIKPGKSWAFLKDGEQMLFPTGGLMNIIRSKMVPFIETLKLLLSIKKMEPNDFYERNDVSLEEWLKKEKLSEKTRRFLLMTSSAMQVNPFPERSSIGELMHNIKRVLEVGSVYYPSGGWNSIFSQFIDKIRENDGDIRLNSEVEKIIVEDNICKGVEVNGDKILSNHIISTIPVQNLFTILNENLCDKEFVEKCRELRPTAGVSIDFCLDKSISDIDGLMFFEEPLGFGFIPSNLSAEVAPEGKSLMTFLRVANIKDIKNKNKAEELYKEFRDTIIKFFPNIENHILHERFLFLEMVDGVEVNTNQHQFKRPGNRIKGIQNLWLAGDSVGGEGAGGDIGHTSVRECYKQILDGTE
jgi:phytoene dehydrogenase-like protein